MIIRARVTLVIIAVVAIEMTALGAPRTRARTKPRSANEPFNSFRSLDTQLTRFDQQLAALKKTVGNAPGKRAVWTTSARRMRPTLAAVRRINRRLLLRYRRTRRRFAIRAFTRMDKQATVMSKRLHQIMRARSQRLAGREVDELAHTMLALVMDFQHVSGGYGAVHCAPREWACCQPKPDITGGHGEEACALECVQQVQSCKGFPGPRTPRR